MLVALVILGRNAYYLLVGDAADLFSYGQQQAITVTLGAEVPMLLMTVLWPLVFAMLNLIHAGMKMDRSFFTVVLLVHIGTCWLAAWILYTGSFDPQVVSETEFLTTVWGATILSSVATIGSFWIFSKNTLFGAVPAAE